MKIKSKSNKKKVIISIIILVTLLVGSISWAAIAQVGPFATEQTTKHQPKKSKQENEKGQEETATETNTKTPNDNVAQPNASFTPTKPTGTFVSNHNPNLSGSPAPNRMSSTCQTTPGVYCTIQFTKGGVVKSLPQKKTDSSGSTTWNWQLQDIGLTVGNWSIEAIAKNGDKTSKAQDAMSLRIDK